VSGCIRDAESHKLLDISGTPENCIAAGIFRGHRESSAVSDVLLPVPSYIDGYVAGSTAVIPDAQLPGKPTILVPAACSDSVPSMMNKCGRTDAKD